MTTTQLTLPLAGESPKEFRLRAVAEILAGNSEGMSFEDIYLKFNERYAKHRQRTQKDHFRTTLPSIIRSVRLLEAREQVSFELSDEDQRIKLWFLLGQ